MFNLENTLSIVIEGYSSTQEKNKIHTHTHPNIQHDVDEEK